ncbi:MAG: family lipase [Anaerocolumna sp.]|jgi:lysophospholipase L1-like esterase|nr:family lipase [Anaerocolumna sp.]
MINVTNKNYFKYEGRTLYKETSAILGWTNSSVTFYVKGSSTQTTIYSRIETKNNGEENEARLKIYLDGKESEDNLLVLHDEDKVYTLATFMDDEIHKVTIIKITEAAMSHAKIDEITVTGGEIIPLLNNEDNRLKIEFIGDSITCGYGVYGEPESEYHIREEDGMVTYAAYAAKALDLNARYTAVSGFGMYIKYDGDLTGILPRVYPYTNYFADENEKYNFNEFIPDLFVINLGTNDSGHLEKPGIAESFIKNYIEFLHFLKSYAPESKILCICGSLCTNAFEFIEQAVTLAKSQGLTDIYMLELPFHDVDKDGKASNHPSIQTHEKDGIRIANKLKEII